MRKDALEVSAPDLAEPADRIAPLSLPIILSAVPGIALVWSELWIMVGLLDWSIGSLVLPGMTGIAVVGALTLGPALFASWKLMISAVRAEQVIAAG